MAIELEPPYEVTPHKRLNSHTNPEDETGAILYLGWLRSITNVEAATMMARNEYW